jgi:hypothetical protein
MPQNANRKPPRLTLADIATRQPDAGAPCSALTLGGITLYAADADWLSRSVDRIQKALEEPLREHLLLVRNQLEKLAKERIGEEVSDRVLGAVIGRSLRFGVGIVLPCLTSNGNILRMYAHSKNLSVLNEKLGLLDALVSEKSAISVEAAQLACFPVRGWGSKFIAKQLLSHLAYRGRAVFVDDDLFASPLPSIEHANRNRRK